jgi:hypothetical protein
MDNKLHEGHDKKGSAERSSEKRGDGEEFRGRFVEKRAEGEGRKEG